MLPFRVPTRTAIAAWLVAAVVAASSAPLGAIVLRHDRDAARAVELARRFPMAVTVRRATGQRFGDEAVVIRPAWALSAAHVAAHLGPGDVIESAGVMRRITRVVLHPLWHSDADIPYDIALIQFDEPFRSLTPAAVYTQRDEAGRVVTFVGRGRFGTGLTGPTGEDRVPRAATNRVESAEATLLRFRFDAPDDDGVTDLEGVSGPGDSGGGAFIERDGVTFVVGISSAQDARPTGRRQGRYGVIEIYPRVSAFAEWIAATVDRR